MQRLIKTSHGRMSLWMSNWSRSYVKKAPCRCLRRFQETGYSCRILISRFLWMKLKDCFKMRMLTTISFISLLVIIQKFQFLKLLLLLLIQGMFFTFSIHLFLYLNNIIYIVILNLIN